VLFPVEELFDGDAQRRHPMRLLPVKTVGEFYELIQRPFTVHRDNVNDSQSSCPL
jgi:hypothetical protein